MEWIGHGPVHKHDDEIQCICGGYLSVLANKSDEVGFEFLTALAAKSTLLGYDAV
jgi:hypothetical protein